MKSHHSTYNRFYMIQINSIGKKAMMIRRFAASKINVNLVLYRKFQPDLIEY